MRFKAIKSSLNSCLSERDDDDDTELSESIPLVFNDMIFENSNNNSHTFCWTISDNEAYDMDEDNEGSSSNLCLVKFW
ncbi:hypothetical protein Tco_1300550 [Tanacetum coccineum]